jgi:hypothetical protein
MKIAIMQTYLFPYLDYFQLMNSVDKFILYDDVNYIKRGWINRNRIQINGQEHLFTIPLKEASQNKLICETNILVNAKWKYKFLKTIEYSYKRAPEFCRIFPLIKLILELEENRLSRFIGYSALIVASYLQISSEIKYSSSVQYDCSLSGPYRILDICCNENATCYHNPIGGITIYRKDIFAAKGLDLKFIKPHFQEYKQFNNNKFMPALSIIDVLMFNSVEKIQVMLSDYETV